MNTRSDINQDVCDVIVTDAAAVGEAKSSVPDASRLSGVAETFSALGDPTRLTILFALSRRELCVCDLAAVTGVSQSAVSHQLRLLRQLRLVAFTRDGRRAVYRLADDHVRDLLAIGLEHESESRGGDAE